MTEVYSEVPFWAVIPAAGVGSRMQADRPKQYLPLHGRTVLEHSLARMAAHPAVTGLVVVISAEDAYWPTLNVQSDKPLLVVDGGDERCHSVLNGLTALAAQADEGSWVLVHDAARPCVRLDDIDLLLRELSGHACGGLLGLPVADTLKACDEGGAVVRTVDRTGLWRALTPQMFRLGELKEALERALAEGFLVTDEASAMENAGHRPQMVAGHGDNIKITHPQDLRLAELYLAQQEASGA